MLKTVTKCDHPRASATVTKGDQQTPSDLRGKGVKRLPAFPSKSVYFLRHSAQNNVLCK